MELSGKSVVVMGSTRGIGRAIARKCGELGALVIVTGRTQSDGEEVVKLIAESGGTALFQRTDVTVEDDIKAAINLAVEKFGKLDGVVNNVADFGKATLDGPVTEITLEGWEQIIRADLTSAFLGMKYGISAMLKNPEGGSVVNIASEACIRGFNGVDGYTASKGAIMAMTRSTASYYARYEVRVNALAVGFVQTENDRINMLMSDPNFRDGIEHHHLGKIGQPNEIAEVAAFFLSSRSAYISGVTLPIDAGSSAASHIPRPLWPDLPDTQRRRPNAPAF
jgi:NAD(P)-dependent dehydrogenase (short-subunit alcohol dehydrogenase family)